MFSGLKFLGSTSSLIPDELRWEGIFTGRFKTLAQQIDAIREWALNKEIVWEPDQFITDEAIEELSKVFAPDNNLSVAIHVTSHGNNPEAYTYLEYPFVPIGALIKIELEVELAYWSMEPDLQRSGDHSDHNGVRFGYWLQDASLEFVSISYSKVVAKKFEDLLHELSIKYPIVLPGAAGHTQSEVEITVNGDIKAKFVKVQTAHDVHFTVSPTPYWEREGTNAK